MMTTKRCAALRKAEDGAQTGLSASMGYRKGVTKTGYKRICIWVHLHAMQCM
ncbi:protein of unknown function [Desulfovibrio sp. 86]|nr:protein of unknown function [Desulfovibrio sp. 86]